MKRTCLLVTLASALFVVFAVSLNGQQSPQDDSTSNPTQTSSSSNPAAVSEDLVNEKQEREMGNQDTTYLKSRTVVKYDHKWAPGDGGIDRFRSFSFLAFGRQKTWAFTAEMPFVVHVARPHEEVTGVGDLELKFGKLITKGERFRQAIGTQLNVETGSNDAIGGTATVLKALYFNSYAPAKNWLIFGSLNYAHSVHLADGASTVSTIEPEVTLSHGFPWFSAYLHFDNYYDFPVSEWGNTVKLGVAKTMGKRQLWTIDVYNEYGINAYARAKFTNDLGINVTRFFGAN